MTEQIVNLTEAAVIQIKEMLNSHNETDAYLRVSVKGGGCSGLSYGMEVDHEVKEDDFIYNQDGLRLLVDKISAPILKGTVIDYKQSLLGGGFTIDNPNAIANCGCGASFRTATEIGTPEKC